MTSRLEFLRQLVAAFFGAPALVEALDCCEVVEAPTELRVNQAVLYNDLTGEVIGLWTENVAPAIPTETPLGTVVRLGEIQWEAI